MTDQAKAEIYTPPTLTVIGSLAADTRIELNDAVRGFKSPSY
jgi:hypothetical protein